MKSIVILISGRGSNLSAIVETMRRERWPAEIAAVISSRRDAGGLDRAREFGIAAEAVDHREFATREAFEARLLVAIERYRPDAIALAGFMRVLSADFVLRFPGRLVNIHPSLLPSFPGLGTHRQALAAGVKVHGATVHFVTPELDHGPIIAQAAVPVEEDDTESTLAARVLVEEHVIYPRALRWMVEDRVTISDGRVHIDHSHRPTASSERAA